MTQGLYYVRRCLNRLCCHIYVATWSGRRCPVCRGEGFALQIDGRYTLPLKEARRVAADLREGRRSTPELARLAASEILHR